MAKVEIRTSSDAQQALQAFDAMLKKKDQAIRKLRQLSQESRKAGQENLRHAGAMGDSTSSTLQSVAQMATAYIGIRQTLALITAEMRSQRELGRESLKQNENIAMAAGRASRATSGQLAAGELPELVAGISSRAGVEEKEIYQAFAGAGAAGVGRERLIQSVEAAAQSKSVFGDEPAVLASRLAQISKVADVSPEAGLGFLMRTRKTLDVKDFDTLVQRIAPSLIGATRSGGTLEGATELSSLLQQAQPELRGTSAKLSADVFQRAFQQASIPVAGAGGKIGYQTLSEAAPEVKTFADFIPFIQKQMAAMPKGQRPEALSRLLVGTGGARAELQGLFTGEAGATQRFARIQEELAPPSEGDVDVFRAAVGEAEGIPAVSLALAGGQSKTAISRAKRQREGLAVEEQVLQTIQGVLEVGGAGVGQKWLTGKIGEMTMDTPQEAIGALEALSQDVMGSGRGVHTEAPPGMGWIPGFGGADFSELGAEERGQLHDSIQEMVRLLERVVANTAATNDTLNVATTPVG